MWQRNIMPKRKIRLRRPSQSKQPLLIPKPRHVRGISKPRSEIHLQYDLKKNHAPSIVSDVYDVSLFYFGNPSHALAISAIVSQLARTYGEFNLCRRVIRYPQERDPFAYDRCSLEEWRNSIVGEDNIVAINRDNPFQVYTLFTGVDRSRVINSECDGYVTLVFNGPQHMPEESITSTGYIRANYAHDTTWRRIQTGQFRYAIRS